MNRTKYETKHCPGIAELDRAATGGELPTDLAAHIARCDACAARVRELRQNQALFQEVAAVTSRDTDDRAAPIGLKIDGYDLLATLSYGGQGVVYRARQQSTARIVAIKVLRDSPLRGPAERARFDREVQLLARLDHPNLITVHDAGRVDHYHYYVMDLVDGPTLDAYVANRSLSIRDIVALFRGVCDAVRAAHVRGISHRDLKPSNVRVNAQGRPLVLDFGLAKVVDDPADDATRFDTITQSGQFVGSPPWASPEQADGRADLVDLRTDVYSLGVLLFQLLTGSFPYDVTGPARLVLDRVANAEPINPRSKNSEIDADLATIVLACLEKDPDRRYQTAADLLRDIDHWLAREPIERHSYGAGELLRRTVKRNRRKLAVGIVAGSMLLLAAYLLVTDRARRHWQQVADSQTIDLRRALRSSELERGRVELRADRAWAAEQIFWNLALQQNPFDWDADWDAGRYPTDPLYWAMWEFYDREPSTASFTSHAGRIWDYAYLDHSHFVIVQPGVVQIWNFKTGQIEELPGFSGLRSVSVGKLSEDGRWLFATKDGVIERYAIDDPENVRTVTISKPVETWFLRIDQNGSSALVGTRDRGVFLWNVETNELTPVQAGTNPLTSSTYMSADGHMICAVVGDGNNRSEIILRDREQTGFRTTLAGLDRPYVLSLAADEMLWNESRPGGFSRTDLATRATERFVGENIDIRHADAFGEFCDFMTRHETEFVPDPKYENRFELNSMLRYVAGGRDGAIGLWGRDREMRGRFSSHNTPIRGIRLSPDRTTFATFDADNTIRVWACTARSRMRVPAPPYSCHSSRWPGAAGRLVIGGQLYDAKGLRGESYTAIWDERENRSVFLPGFKGPAAHFCWSSDGTRIVGAGFDGSVKVFHLTPPLNIEEVRSWFVATKSDRTPDKIGALAINSDGTMIVTGQNDGTLRLFDETNDLQSQLVATFDDRISRIDFSPDDERFACSSSDGSVAVFRVADLHRLTIRKPGRDRMRVVQFGPDNQTLAYAGDGVGVRILNLKDNSEFELVGRNSEIYAVAFSPCGRVLAVGDRTGTIRLWDIRSRRMLCNLQREVNSADMVFDLDFSRTGARLAAGKALSGAVVYAMRNYERHMAGHVERQLQRLRAEMPELLRDDLVTAWRNWAQTRKR